MMTDISTMSLVPLLIMLQLVLLQNNNSILISVDALSSTPPPPTPITSAKTNTKRKILRVCQSPGCKDDGATATFDYLSAMAPPGIDVVKGVCVSLCGSGPVVEICGNNVDDATLIKKKRVKGSEAVVSLLDECVAVDNIKNDGAQSSVEPALKPHLRDRLLNGYKLSLKANEAYRKKNYQLAVELYTDAIESGRKPAMMLHEARIEFRDDDDVVVGGNIDDETSNLEEEGTVQWLVTSFKNSCRSRLVLKDVDGARRDAFAATVFSRSLDADAHECLAEVCAASSDALGELQGIKAAIKQYERMEEVYSKLANAGADAPTRAEAAKNRNHAAARKQEGAWVSCFQVRTSGGVLNHARVEGYSLLLCIANVTTT